MKSSTAVIALALVHVAPLAAAFQQGNATRALQAFPHPAVCDVIQDNVDFPGGDMYGFQAPSATLCCDACYALIQCNAFTWTKYDGGSCYLKLSVPGGNAVPNAPLPDGSPYMSSAVVYKCQKLLQDTDFIATDLPNVPATSADMCCGICRNTATCDKFSWSSYNGGTCWLKTGTTYTNVYAPGVISGLVN